MKMAVSLYLFVPYSASFALPSLLLLYVLCHKCYWLKIISECQTKKMNNNETLLAMQNTENTTQ